MTAPLTQFRTTKPKTWKKDRYVRTADLISILRQHGWYEEDKIEQFELVTGMALRMLKQDMCLMDKADHILVKVGLVHRFIELQVYERTRVDGRDHFSEHHFG